MGVKKMRDEIEPEVSGRDIEEHLLDANSDVCDTILMGETIETTRGKLEDCKNWGMDTYGVFKSFFHFFSVDPTPQCPEFVEWCAENFSATKRVIMNKYKSKILFPVRASIICKTLDIPDTFIDLSQDYREEDIIHYFRESTDESKEAFLKNYSKPDSGPIDLSYPIDLSRFSEETQWCISLASQFLGIDIDAYVPESLLSLLFVLDTCPDEPKLLRQSSSLITLSLMSS